MSSCLLSSSGSLSRIGLIGIALWACPSGLSSQGVSLPQQTTSTGTEHFAEFDATLIKAADVLLVSGTQSPRPEIISTADGKASGTGLTLKDDHGSYIPLERADRAVAARLSFLRPAVEPILRSHGVPAALAAVILVESGGGVDALSPKGARGLWQLMPATARRYGLRVDEFRDDRLDIFKGTDAAARYLHDLFAQFGDWKLTLAAYNAGEASVSYAIRRAHTEDFDQLTNLRMLPLETTIYVPRVMATAQFVGHSPMLVENRSVHSAITVFAVNTP